MKQDATKYVLRAKDILLGVQFLFVAFGALVLVPLLTGLNPNVALFTAGLGTLVFQLITRKAVPPIFLASSFAFIAPISIGVEKWGIAATMSGLIAAGCVYVCFSFLIKFFWKKFLDKILPAIVVGPVIMSIWLILAPVAVFMSIGKTGDGAAVLVQQDTAMIISLCTLLVVIIISLIGKWFLRLFSILIGIIVGCGISLYFGIIDFSKIQQASWFIIPEFTAPKFSWEAILFILPIAIAPAVEHIWDMLAISNITKKDYTKEPGLDKTLLWDGVATITASLFGGPPNTTYSEVTGAVAITKSYNPAIMTWAALAAILLSFNGKVGALLASIPTPVMWGIMLLLFGVITSIGIKTLATANIDFDCPRNLAIIAIILVFSIGGMQFDMGIMSLSGIGLGAITGIVLNLVLPQAKKDD